MAWLIRSAGIGALVLIGWASIGAQPPVPAAPSPSLLAGEVIPGRYVVMLKEGFLPNDVAAAHAILPSQVYSRVFNGFAGPVSPGRLTALQRDPRVERVVSDRTVSA